MDSRRAFFFVIVFLSLDHHQLIFAHSHTGNTENFLVPILFYFQCSSPLGKTVNVHLYGKTVMAL
ncbi:hypothetical protein B840_12545 (plasmid) [Corynebacterium marinum DSM 44953]|uniref:Uncharacterized protein n=1 Tax=Corynebacterium marinum DSM 44953 TaxID=1224162 RepID=A0A0B6TJD8_9CORY|nr:hypothetical protein B840_12545 [Corynebacterium marinum DSM 44953]